MSAVSGASAPSHARQEMPWLIIAAGSVVAMLTFGPRSAMGFFQLPMLADTRWDRTTFGLAMALQNLCWGLSQPFFGAIADRFGTWRVLAMSGLLYAAGLIIMAFANAPIWLHIGGGVLVGMAVGSGSFGILLEALLSGADLYRPLGGGDRLPAAAADAGLRRHLRDRHGPSCRPLPATSRRISGRSRRSSIGRSRRRAWCGRRWPDRMCKLGRCEKQRSILEFCHKTF